MSIINSTLPAFKVQAYQNEAFRTVSSTDLAGKWSVFFFYPADFTFVCPTELGDVADIYPELQKMGVEVYSVSTDTHFTHKAWHDASPTIKKIAYPMLADPTGTLTRGFGVHIEEEGLAYRGTFVVAPDGRSRSPRSTTTASDAMPRSCCARSRPRSSWPATRAKSAPRSGNRVQPR
jgi:NADH-dependent peroxiredoxin subunit C